MIVGRSDSFRYAQDTNEIAAEVRQALEAWSTCRTLSEVYLQMAGTLLSAKEPIAPTTTYRVLTGFQMAETVPMNQGGAHEPRWRP